MAKIRVGVSGWSYRTWRGSFYPDGLRLHGPGEVYASRYSGAELDRWARRVRAWSAAEEPADARRITDRSPPARRGRDAHVYFDNDQHGYAPDNARGLLERLRA